MFQQYIDAGWKLCPIPPGTKGPRSEGWNRSENALVSASNISGAGLMHAYSGPCALDIDDLEKTAVFLKEHGIDVNVLLSAPDAVQIVSGRPNRRKLLYALETPLSSKSLCDGAFELRCASSNGRSVQDVLPPTMHPAGAHYTWKGDWRALPPIPEALLAFWKSSCGEIPVREPVLGIRPYSQEVGNSIKAILTKQDVNSGYHEWIKIMMAVHHETGGSDEGLALFDEWSHPGRTYPGLEAIRSHWDSFGHSSAAPVTLDSLRRGDVADPATFPDLTATGDWFTDSKAESVRQLEYRSLSILESRNRPEPNWIIPGILPEAEFGVIYGPGSSGKTFLTIDIGLSVATGRPWRGCPVKKGPVYYVAAEDGRGAGMRFGYALDASGRNDAAVRILHDAPRIRVKASQDALIEELERHSGLSMVVFDTMAAVIPGAEENSAKDIGEVTSFCLDLHKKTKALIILVHHTGKNHDGGARGSSAIVDNAQIVWKVSQTDKVLWTHEMTTEKIKNGVANLTFPFRRVSMGSSCVVEWMEDLDQILEVK